MSTPQTDTPETDAECGAPDDATWPGAYVSSDFARTLERRAIAAEARVKELESRLQIDPGGSDKIDELESAINFLKDTIRASDDKVKELEAANAELIQRLLECAEVYRLASKYDVQTIEHQTIEIGRLRAALRLRPIAEAGPVPDGMIRLYASRIPLGPPGAEFWSAFSETDEEDTHCVDVLPPAQAEEGQARP